MCNIDRICGPDIVELWVENLLERRFKNWQFLRSTRTRPDGEIIIQAVQPVVDAFADADKSPDSDYQGPGVHMTTINVLEWALARHPKGSPEMIWRLSRQRDYCRAVMGEVVERLAELTGH